MNGIREQPCFSSPVPNVPQKLKCRDETMRQHGGKSVVFSFRTDRKLETIISNANLPLCDLVENGLLSLAKNPASKNDKLLEGAISICEEKISYYSGCLKELMDLKDAPKQEIAAAIQPQKESASIPVKGKSGKRYWITASLHEKLPNMFQPTDGSEDGAGDWEPLYSVDDVPEYEFSEEEVVT